MATAKRIVAATMKSAWWSLRYILFSMLFYLRGIITGVLRFVASMSLLGFIAGLIFIPHSSMTWGMLGLGFGCFVSAMIYDLLIILMKPHDGTELELWN